jgi:hypothetical protein
MADHLGYPVPSGHPVHHRNGDKSDNSIGNLELLTTAEHTRRHMLGNKHTARFTEDDVRLIRAAVAFGPRGTQARIAQDIGVSDGVICNIIKRRSYDDVPDRLEAGE